MSADSADVELTARIAAVYGVDVAGALEPDGDTSLSAVVQVATQLAQAIGAHRAQVAAFIEPTWAAIAAPPMATPAPADRARAVARLEAWAIAGGARFDGLALDVSTDGECSLRAARDLAAGEVIITVPRRLILTDRDLAASATGDVDAMGPTLRNARDSLAVWLPLEAARADSPWRPYLDVLPLRFPDMPLFRGGPELAPLEATAAHLLAAEAVASVTASYASLRDEVSARVSLPQFAWGRAITQSRGFNAPDTLAESVAFIPIVDLLNHGPDGTRWRYDLVTRTYEVTTVRPFAAGREVVFSYGPYGNGHLLVDYGFVLPDNAEADATLVFAAADDPWTDLAAHLLWRLRLGVSTHVVVTARFDHRLRRALSIARLHACGPADRLLAAERELMVPELPWLGVVVERAALAGLAAAARGGLDRLGPPTRAAPSTSWHAACAAVRANERALLQDLIGFAAAAAAALADPEPTRLEAAAAAISLDTTGSPGLLRDYLHTIAHEIASL